MRTIGTKVVEWTLTVYHYIVLALYFWVGILRGLILYGITPACVSVFLTYEAMKKNEDVDDKYIKQQFFKHYRNYDHYKLLSFLISIGLLLLMALFTYSLARGVSLVLVVVIIYFLLLLIGTMSFTFYHLMLNKKPGRLAFAEGFVEMIKELKVTVPLVIAVALLLGILYYNAVLFLIVFPAGYAAVVTGLVKKSSQS
ncbi:Protein of unknown function, DUF624 [Halolactibacillus halophilus]|uniref:Uncharacterized protein n=1 Tax=Halolactibacillus halophilus TaxID=306540 RepID=A0A1I5LY41_9BACI|nr:DUF624 domain-containing protein [Halolactibacillus halophilus]GEM00915.1 hypothetical protein HHA03_04470 [Halolactibacillus halophilus]SFP01681.1 Protein of unknown function, DUF624 [Halolactibacillus halophilus]